MSRHIVNLALAVGIALVAPATARAGCPSADVIEKKIEAFGLERAARTSRFDVSPPSELYAKAVKKLGEPFAVWKGKMGFSVMVAERPVERIWMAISDEEHHDLNGYLPVRHSEVIERDDDLGTRLIFQWFKQMGVGRWWVSRVEVSKSLYKETGGMLWEVHWVDDMQNTDPTQSPMSSVSTKLTPIRASKGSWLLVPLAEDCTLIEHFSWSDPGGFAGFAQPLMAKKALRNTVNGIVRLADEHAFDNHPDEVFLRPDGTRME
jgi:hypothetical protein